MSKNNISSSVECGLIGENLVIKIFENAGYAVSEQQLRIADYDIKLLDCHGREITIEIKYDIKSMQTGNVAIEFLNSKQNKNSGISVTTADFWAFVFPNNEIWITSVQELIQFIHDTKPLKIIYGAGDGNAGIMLYQKDNILPKIFYRIDTVDPNDISEYVSSSLKWV